MSDVAGLRKSACIYLNSMFYSCSTLNYLRENKFWYNDKKKSLLAPVQNVLCALSLGHKHNITLIALLVNGLTFYSKK